LSYSDVDVIIVGAGVAGIGIAMHLERRHPDKTYAILDRREDIGGTWDLFRYPGVRSDSDLHTYAYTFKPWIDDHALADGPSILRYLDEAVVEHGIRDQIRFGYTVLEAGWSSDDARWTIVAERRDDGERVELTARWLVSAAGYFRYDQGYTPDLAGLDRFGGTVVHPQHWPENLDHSEKRVVVIGSGATAVTLVPALSRRARHVTMLQRTPSYMLSMPGVDPVYQAAKRMLGAVRAHRITRRKNLCYSLLSYRAMRRFPRQSSKVLRSAAAKQLPDGYDVDKHFTPPYDPWDQRLCAVLDGDLFEAVSSGRVSVVTDTIREITESGLALESGTTIDADIIVTATGLDLVPMGDVAYSVDGRPVRLNSTVAYKSMMLSGLPNFVFVFGYTNDSWTLKVDLVAEHFCRLLSLMDEREYDYAVPEGPHPDLPTAPMIDLTSGYISRGIDRFPRQGPVAPWLVKMDYAYDRKVLLRGPVGDHLRLARTVARQSPPLRAVGAGHERRFD
jgi:monooxygenase